MDKNKVLKIALIACIVIIIFMGYLIYSFKVDEDVYTWRSIRIDYSVAIHHEVQQLRDFAIELYTLGTVNKQFEYYDFTSTSKLMRTENGTNELIGIDNKQHYFDWRTIIDIYKITRRINKKEKISDEDKEYLLKASDFLNYLYITYKEEDRRLSDIQDEKEYDKSYDRQLCKLFLEKIEAEYSESDMSYLRDYEVKKDLDIVMLSTARDNDEIRLSSIEEYRYLLTFVEKLFDNKVSSNLVEHDSKQFYTFTKKDKNREFEYEIHIKEDDRLTINLMLQDYEIDGDVEKFNEQELLARSKEIIEKLKLGFEVQAIETDIDYNDVGNIKVIDEVGVKYARVVDSVIDETSTIYVELDDLGSIKRLNGKGLYEQEDINRESVDITEDMIRNKLNEVEVINIDLIYDRKEYRYKANVVVNDMKYYIWFNADTGECISLDYDR